MENLSLKEWSNRNNQVLTLILLLSSEFPPKPLGSMPEFETELVESRLGISGMIAVATGLNNGSFAGIMFALASGSPVFGSKPYPSRIRTPPCNLDVAGLN